MEENKKNKVPNVPNLRFSEFVDDYQFTDIKSVSIFVKDGTHGTHQDVEIGMNCAWPLLNRI